MPFGEHDTAMKPEDPEALPNWGVSQVYLEKSKCLTCPCQQRFPFLLPFTSREYGTIASGERIVQGWSFDVITYIGGSHLHVLFFRCKFFGDPSF